MKKRKRTFEELIKENKRELLMDVKQMERLEERLEKNICKRLNSLCLKRVSAMKVPSRCWLFFHNYFKKWHS